MNGKREESLSCLESVQLLSFWMLLHIVLMISRLECLGRGKYEILFEDLKWLELPLFVQLNTLMSVVPYVWHLRSKMMEELVSWGALDLLPHDTRLHLLHCFCLPNLHFIYIYSFSCPILFVEKITLCRTWKSAVHSFIFVTTRKNCKFTYVWYKWCRFFIFMFHYCFWYSHTFNILAQKPSIGKSISLRLIESSWW